MPGAADLADADVQAAIDCLVRALLDRRSARHHWDPARWTDSDGSRAQVGGYTALVAYALLEAGTSPSTPGLAEALVHLGTTELTGSYAVSLRAMTFAALPEDHRAVLEGDLRRLLETFRPDTAGWGYDLAAPRRRRDLSIRQYGALALWRGAEAGARIPDAAWRAIEQGYLEDQLPDGGWNYLGDDAPARGSMVAAGLATLAITRDRLHGPALARLDDRGARPGLEAFERGLAWMDRHFTPDTNPGTDRWYEYWAYGVERVGLASGLRTFGGRDWFRELAAELMRRHLVRTDEGGYAVRRENARTDTLAFTLLFLARGRVPVVVTKLRIDDLRWNNRPGDAARFVQWLGDRTERGLAWQVVRLDADAAAEADEVVRALARSPVTLLASDRPLPFAPRDADPPRGAGQDAPLDARAARLRDAIEAGGLLVALDEGGGSRLTRSVEALARRLWPHLSFEELPDEHPAWTVRRTIERRAVRMRRLSNGVRDYVVLVERPDAPGVLQAGGDDRAQVREVLANLVLGRTELGPGTPRLGAPADDARAAATGTGPLAIAVFAPEPGFDPEPAAFEAFRRWAEPALGRPVELRRIADPAAAGDAQLLVVVRADGALAPEHADALAAWTRASDRRLVLLATAGGRGGFAGRAALDLADRIGARVGPLDRHPLLRAGGAGGFDAEAPDRRAGTRIRRGGRDRAAGLQAVRDGQRIVAVAADDDLVFAQLDVGAWEVDGYATGAARRLLANLLLWAHREVADDLANTPTDADRGAQTPP